MFKISASSCVNPFRPTYSAWETPPEHHHGPESGEVVVAGGNSGFLNRTFVNKQKRCKHEKQL